MSVAVSPYLLPPQAAPLPSGKQADLLDALLASCQKSTMPLPGFGRNLQPYFTTETSFSSSEQSATKPAHPNIKGKQKQKKFKGKLNSPSPSTSSDEEASQKSVMKSTPKPATHKIVQDTSKGQTIKAVYSHQKAGSLEGMSWAGPAYGMAPAASEIPIPSDFLLV